MGVGEILDGDRRYFPRPVAYDNRRGPIIPTQIRPQPLASGLGQFLEETTVGDAIKPAAALFGIPIGGFFMILCGAALLGFARGYVETKAGKEKGRRRRAR
jgi:hypothetical protein